jgi:phosphotransacetylase
MKPLFDRAPGQQRVVYAEGEEDVVLHAVQTVADEARAILIGRPAVIERAARSSASHRGGRDFDHNTDRIALRVLEPVPRADGCRRHARVPRPSCGAPP